MELTAADFNVVNATAENIDELNKAIAYLSQSPTALSILEEVKNSETPISITDGENKYFGISGLDPNGSINWNPKSALIVYENGVEIGVHSAAIGLIHEASHAADPSFYSNLRTRLNGSNMAESVAIQAENKVAEELGEVQRFNHGGKSIKVDDPTLHASKNSFEPSGMRWVNGDRVIQPAPAMIEISTPAVEQSKPTSLSEQSKSAPLSADAHVMDIINSAYVASLSNNSQAFDQALQNISETNFANNLKTESQELMQVVEAQQQAVAQRQLEQQTVESNAMRGPVMKIS